MKTKIIIGLAIFIVSGYIAWSYIPSIPVVPYTQTNQNNVQDLKSPPVYAVFDLKVEFSSTNIITFENIELNKPHTALEISQNFLKIKSTAKGVNAFVTEINGRKADDSKKEFWAFYINGKQAEVGAGSYVIKNSDTIEWKIKTY